MFVNDIIFVKETHELRNQLEKFVTSGRLDVRTPQNQCNRNRLSLNYDPAHDSLIWIFFLFVRITEARAVANVDRLLVVERNEAWSLSDTCCLSTNFKHFESIIDDGLLGHKFVVFVQAESILAV